MNKKGFTLIELLAVIVILAVIALIATPIILNMISTAKKGAAVDSAYGYIDAIETNNAMNSIDPEKYPLITDTDVAEINKKVKIKGEKPASGTVTLEKGKVTTASLCINGYTVVYENNKAKATKKCEEKEDNKEEDKEEGGVVRPEGPTIVESTNGETYKAIVYLNPKDLNEKCNASNSKSTPGTNEGCMKWYAYKKNSDGTYQLILDHNTTAQVAWNSFGDNTKGMKEAQDELNKLVSDSKWVKTPTLITADEIADITGASSETTIKWHSNKPFGTTIDTQSSWFYLDGASGTDPKWQTPVAKTQGASNYAWLYDYTLGCIANGCNNEDSSTYGYWTQTPVSGNTNCAWGVSDYGDLFYGNVDNVNYCGVRPVINF